LNSADGQLRRDLADNALWILLVVLTPLWVNPWAQQPFELAKVTLARTLIWVLFGLVLVRSHRAGPSLWDSVRTNPLAMPVTLLAVVIVVTTVTAVDWRLSLWGSYDRAQGAVTLLSYLLLFFLASHQLRSLSRARLVMQAMVACGGALALLGIAQALGWNPFNFLSDARSQIYITLGRANFVGAYLAMLSPLALAMMLQARDRRRQIGFGVVLAAMVIVIVLTTSRGAWVAAAVALSIVAISWWGHHISVRLRYVAWSAIILLVLSGPIAVFLPNVAQSGSSAARTSIWQGSLELIAQRPLLGYGADSMGIVFPAVYPPELVYDLGRDFFVDRAHNLILDWGIASGLPGMIAFGLIVVLFVQVVWGAIAVEPSGPKRALLIAILASVLGNLTNNLVSFDVTTTAAATWLLMGMGIALTAPTLDDLPEQPARAKQTGWQWTGIVFVLAGLALAVWQANLRPMLADIAARSAARAVQAGNVDAAIALGERAVQRWPLEPAHYLSLSSYYWTLATLDVDEASLWLERADSLLIQARTLRPADPTLWLVAGSFYAAASHQFGSQTAHLADQSFQQAVTLSPNNAHLYTSWGEIILSRGDAAAAAPLLRRAVQLDASSGIAYLHLGQAEQALGRVEIAIADYLEAVRLLPDSAPAYTGLASAYWALEETNQALAAIEAALLKDPDYSPAKELRQIILAGE
jgi:O-antigen ligase/Tfp pilus assembly protein PilF